MPKLTIAQLSAHSGLSERLIRSTAKQFRGWRWLLAYARAIASPHEMSEWTGFSFVADCTQFYRKHRAEIDTLIIEKAALGLGMCPIEFIRNLDTVRRQKHELTGGLSTYEAASGWLTDTAITSNDVQVALAQHILVEVAQAILECIEDTSA